jgi:hypothetical protein
MSKINYRFAGKSQLTYQNGILVCNMSPRSPTRRVTSITFFAAHYFNSVSPLELSQNSPANKKKKNLCHSSYKHNMTQISMATTCHLLTGRMGSKEWERNRLATSKLCVCDHVFETLARQKFTLLLSNCIPKNWLHIYLYSHRTCRVLYLVIMDIVYLLFYTV